MSIDDPRLSKEHFEIEQDPEGSWLNITDLGSQNGTWLVILNYLEDKVVPEIEYQNPEMGAFKFEMGTSCYTLEEMIEAYEAPEILSDLCLLDLYSLNDVLEIKQHELETRVTKAMITPDRMEKCLTMMEALRRDFNENAGNLRNRIILKVISGKYKDITIEIGYRGSKIGIVSNKAIKNLVFTSYNFSETFDMNLFDINFKNGTYHLKSYGFSKIYKKFNPQEKHKIFPGHRICAGSQIFTLLQ